MEKIKESPAFKVNGFVDLLVIFTIASVSGWQVWQAIQELIEVLGRSLKLGDFSDLAEFGAWLDAILIVVVIPSISGFFTLEPNQAVVLVFFGRYVGTVREVGF
jgi:hypothetical protein